MVNKIFSVTPLLIIGVLLMLFIVPIIKYIALKFNIVDVPNKRKLHTKPTPLLGGVAVFLGINLLGFFAQPYDNNLLIQMFVPALALVILGVIDDIIDMNAKVKLLFQFLISLYTAYLLGGIQSIQIYHFHFHFPDFLGIIIQSIWFVILINAFNLIDGLDGLATGCGIISILTILIVSCIRGDYSLLPICMIIIGVLLGFLIFNFNPAKIFLGDAGSMLIGFYIATLSFGEYKSVTFTTMLVVGLIAFLPLFDAVLAFIRRKVNGESAFKPDALHFHHRLLLKGFSKTQSVLIIYGIMGIYALASIFISFVPGVWKFVILGFLIIFSIIIIERLYLLSDQHAYLSKLFRKMFKWR